MSGLISVIIPVYNVEDYLDRCLESVVHQTYEEIEIILVDDGSTDSSSLKCDEWGKKDARIKVIHKENEGLSEARNEGIESSKGEFLLFVDSDDCIHRNMCYKLYEMLVKNEADVAVGNVVRFTGQPIEAEISEQCMAVDKYYALEKIATDYIWCVAWGKLYRRELFSGLRYPKGKLHEDEFLIHQVYYRCEKIIYTEEVLYYYYNNPQGIMNGAFTVNRFDIFEALQERILFYKEREENDLYRLTVVELLLTMVRYVAELKACHQREYALQIRESCREILKEHKAGCGITMWKYPKVYACAHPLWAPVTWGIRVIRKMIR